MSSFVLQRKTLSGPSAVGRRGEEMTGKWLAATLWSEGMCTDRDVRERSVRGERPLSLIHI